MHQEEQRTFKLKSTCVCLSNIKTRIAHSRDISGWTEIAHLPQETNTRVHDGLISVSFSKWLDLLLINIIVLRMLNPYSIDYKKNSIYFHRKKTPITHTSTLRIDSYLNQSKKHAILSMHHRRYFNYFFFAHICKTI